MSLPRRRREANGRADEGTGEAVSRVNFEDAGRIPSAVEDDWSDADDGDDDAGGDDGAKPRRRVRAARLAIECVGLRDALHKAIFDLGTGGAPRRVRVDPSTTATLLLVRWSRCLAELPASRPHRALRREATQWLLMETAFHGLGPMRDDDDDDAFRAAAEKLERDEFRLAQHEVASGFFPEAEGECRWVMTKEGTDACRSVALILETLARTHRARFGPSAYPSFFVGDWDGALERALEDLRAFFASLPARLSQSDRRAVVLGGRIHLESPEAEGPFRGFESETDRVLYRASRGRRDAAPSVRTCVVLWDRRLGSSVLVDWKYLTGKTRAAQVSGLVTRWIFPWGRPRTNRRAGAGASDPSSSSSVGSSSNATTTSSAGTVVRVLTFPFKAGWSILCFLAKFCGVALFIYAVYAMGTFFWYLRR